ncbi:hypothetical protein ACQKM2_23190 [Streptomyces sp. NPDC004126]|uniref:hypothetical protein n=1 Tax=Streptomyces sp. NPDC004126 TaxID=3390695 RepID=UPI003D07201E
MEHRALPPRAVCHWNDGTTTRIGAPVTTAVSFGLLAACAGTAALAAAPTSKNPNDN